MVRGIEEDERGNGNKLSRMGIDNNLSHVQSRHLDVTRLWHLQNYKVYPPGVTSFHGLMGLLFSSSTTHHKACLAFPSSPLSS